MPRDNPKRITNRKLLKFTGQQSDCQRMLDRLGRHEQAVKALKSAGVDYDPETGVFTCRPAKPTR